MVVVLSFLGMIAFAPRLERMRAHHWITGGVTVVASMIFYVMLVKSLDYAGRKIGPRLHRLEQVGPQ